MMGGGRQGVRCCPLSEVGAVPGEHVLCAEILELRPTGKDQEDLAATPVAISPGLPKGDPEPQVPQPFPFESITTSETDAAPVTPVTQSPSISISTLSDFTIADASDDESPTDLTVITPTAPSTWRTGTRRYCVGTRYSVCIPASCPFNLLRSVVCSLGPT